MLLSAGEYDATVEKIGKINARAAKRGFTGRLEVIGTRTEQTTKNAIGIDVTEVLYDTKITGEAPSYNGWKFLATLDWDEEAGLIVRNAPGVDSVKREGLKENYCDHCKQNRHRNKTFLVGNEDGTQKQVGSTCLKDFLGWNGNPVFFTEESVNAEIGEFLSTGHYERRWSIDTILATAWAVIQVEGWKPASSYDGNTKSTVLSILDPHSKVNRERAAEFAPYVDKANTQAAIIRAWVLSDAFTGTNDYTINLKAVAGSTTANGRNIGLLVSAPQAWAKAQERDLVRRQEKAELLNEFGGSVGDKLELEVTVKSIRFIDGEWGTSTLYVMVGNDHRIYKWFSSNAALGETTDGTVYRIKGTVKKVEEYNGNKSTVLTRCKIVK